MQLTEILENSWSLMKKMEGAHRMDRVIPSQPAYRLVKSDFIDKILPPLLPVLVVCAGLCKLSPHMS